MELNQKVETRDPIQILQHETGTFHVTGPSGQKEVWLCRANHSVASVKFLETVEPRRVNSYLVEKIASEVSEGGERSRHAAAGA